MRKDEGTSEGEEGSSAVEGRKGDRHVYCSVPGSAGCLGGRPRGRRVDSRPRRLAVRLIQALLDTQEDTFRPTPADGPGKNTWTSTRGEAERVGGLALSRALRLIAVH